MFRCCYGEGAGFTLLEVLITVVILSTGLVLVLQGLHGVLHAWQGGVQRTRTVMAARERLVQVQHAALQDVAPVATSDLQVMHGFEGHEGLYRVALPGEHQGAVRSYAYEMLVYIAPEQEALP